MPYLPASVQVALPIVPSLPLPDESATAVSAASAVIVDHLALLAQNFGFGSAHHLFVERVCSLSRSLARLVDLPDQPIAANHVAARAGACRRQVGFPCCFRR